MKDLEIEVKGIAGELAVELGENFDVQTEMEEIPPHFIMIRFTVELYSKYVSSGMVYATDELKKLINKLVSEHFTLTEEISYNNTGMTFWFYIKRTKIRK